MMRNYNASLKSWPYFSLNVCQSAMVVKKVCLNTIQWYIHRSVDFVFLSGIYHKRCLWRIFFFPRICSFLMEERLKNMPIISDSIYDLR